MEEKQRIAVGEFGEILRALPRSIKITLGLILTINVFSGFVSNIFVHIWDAGSYAGKDKQVVLVTVPKLVDSEMVHSRDIDVLKHRQYGDSLNLTKLDTAIIKISEHLERTDKNVENIAQAAWSNNHNIQSLRHNLRKRQ